jgi:choline dehydrogenase-like flavoprotein
MGNSGDDSVVDAQGRSHDHPNLFITDASVFPSTGGGESPSLTIHALAVRTADSIVRA